MVSIVLDILIDLDKYICIQRENNIIVISTIYNMRDFVRSLNRTLAC